jgi:hypothetical protein
VAFANDEGPIKEFPAYAAHPPFHDRVHSGCLRGREHHADALGLEHLIEQSGELAVPISDQESKVADVLAQIEY